MFYLKLASSLIMIEPEKRVETVYLFADWKAIRSEIFSVKFGFFYNSIEDRCRSVACRHRRIELSSAQIVLGMETAFVDIELNQNGELAILVQWQKR